MGRFPPRSASPSSRGMGIRVRPMTAIKAIAGHKAVAIGLDRVLIDDGGSQRGAPKTQFPVLKPRSQLRELMTAL
jgi:hypothetical protein